MSESGQKILKLSLLAFMVGPSLAGLCRAPTTERASDALPLADETVYAMDSVQDCLQQAERCERQAAEAQLTSNREALLAAAALWRKLAASQGPAAEASPTSAPTAE